MTKAPERIKASYAKTPGRVDGVPLADTWPTTEYVRADIADEMLEALKAAARCLESPQTSLVRQIDAAIAKAEPIKPEEAK